jgi:nucleotide-binding universal stress UspA family protein
MVYVDPERDSMARVRLAGELAERWKSSIIGITARGMPPIVAWTGVAIAQQGGKKEYEKLKELLARTEGQFRAAVQSLDKSCEWRSQIGMPTAFLVRESRAADLLVVGQHEVTQDIYEQLDTGALALSAGRPLLVVPDATRSLSAKSVVIAWKDTREARRAVQDALPLLAAAGRVLIVEVRENGQGEAPERLEALGAHLIRHGVPNPEFRVISGRSDVAEALFDIAQEKSADLIVSGAYGRSRLGEWIFGGVTTTLLNRSPICCLLSH